jgi:tRNA modification GTPase
MSKSDHWVASEDRFVSDTIFAVASGTGKSGVSVIRISGPQAKHALDYLTSQPLEPRRASVRRLMTPDGGVIDEALCLWFPAPNSFTGEDCVEFHCHGALSITALMLETLGSLPDFRLALPGEFSRRAFDHGRMDLSEIEGLADLIDSETEQQRQQAIRQMTGSLGREIDRWRTDLISILSLFEAELDFSDEGDVGSGLIDEAERRLKRLRNELERSLASASHGERIRDGISILLAGPPNAGKSTLLNVLAKRDVAIVSAIPGTTRDLVEVRLDLGGFAVTLLDSAGLRDSSDVIEQEGVRRMLQRAETAEIVLWLYPPDKMDLVEPSVLSERASLVLPVATQIDRLADRPKGLAVSALTGEGIPDLIEALTGKIRELSETSNEGAVLTRARHREAVSEARLSIDRALAALHGDGIELVVEDIRLAMRAIARVTGHVGVEDVLDQLFSQFCIGK